jgi:uncharacterized membrane protein required for colicin V production
VNWLTLAFAVVLCWSVYQGWHRRFAAQAGYLVSQITHLAVAAVALFGAWYLNLQVTSLMSKTPTDKLPDWAAHLWEVWQQSPQTAHMLTLLMIYVVLSTILHWVVRPIPAWIVRLVPRGLGESRTFGGLLGALVGTGRDILLGAAVFVALQFLAVPSLQAQAANSAPYQALSETIYQPWLKPFVTKELPVLTANALEPISKNISLFAVPTGVDGTQQGLLVVPKEISDLAHRITRGISDPREQAHALYEWEIHHIRYDWQKYNDYVYRHKWDQQSPLDTLRTGKGVCADYALLYAEMAHSVGLTVEIDEGIGGTSFQYGPHAWNRVWDPRQGRWLNVDTTWGAEQDAWFDPPGFAATHQVETRIRIEGSRS